MKILFACLTSLWLMAHGALAQAPAGANDEAARRHFESGKAYFERAEYEDAVREFERAYALSGRAPLLINISRAQESAGRPGDAADALERWQTAAASDDPMRSEVAARIQRLRLQAARAEPQPPAPTTPETTATETPRAETAKVEREPPRLGPWLLIGGGAVALASGVTLALLGRSDISTVEEPKAGATWSDVRDEADRGPRRVAIGLALSGVGAAAAAAGVSWLLIGRREQRGPTARLQLTPTGVHLRGRF